MKKTFKVSAPSFSAGSGLILPQAAQLQRLFNKIKKSEVSSRDPITDAPLRGRKRKFIIYLIIAQSRLL